MAKHWTPDEIKHLAALQNKHTPAELAQILNRKLGAIYTKLAWLRDPDRERDMQRERNSNYVLRHKQPKPVKVVVSPPTKLPEPEPQATRERDDIRQPRRAGHPDTWGLISSEPWPGP